MSILGLIMVKIIIAGSIVSSAFMALVDNPNERTIKISCR
jgi:hypothetical protein